MIRRLGANVVEFPKLSPAPPADYGPMDEAIKKLDKFDWIVFSGSNCVENFFERFSSLMKDTAILNDLKTAAIGHGAVKALRNNNIKADYIPPVHTAKEVTEGFGNISGLKLLLVRIEGAAPSLPQKLIEAGAEVTEVKGYRMIVKADREAAEKIFSKKIDAVALPNPTAVMFLLKGLELARMDLSETLKGKLIAVVGPATAETAEEAGLTPGLVSKGHIANLRDSLIEFYKGA
jgi:uroporphyrinogen-III synthase